ncbi:MAG: LysR family transcriptional regulator [Rhodobacterales bacterium CG18_big_fil_WC_8_21_14_2_50_71_9]|nr:MAG: LysR family transcriptional regulator [Rhodobacterales bacterium CG18_big_fil_WC_8_21_14_2_50_71_9]PJA59696.1 MAG: LysR family transcriptional regulator [Rhodobacterales bacterium CG_4_9_14_3_um_filter_71_31]
MELSSRMILFAQVVEGGSFSAAARAAGHAPSAVSRQIALLEDGLGVRLLNRTQSGITLTEAGAAFHARCAEVAALVAEAEGAVAGLGAAPRGALRVAATVAFAKAQLLPILPAFLARHPEITLTLSLTDRPVDLAAENIDVAIRFTEQIGEAAVVARKLAHNRRVICAAPSYLAAHGTPQTPDDLARHNCLRLSSVARWNDWGLTGADGHPAPISGNFEANDADAVYHATLAGVGVARLSSYLVMEDIRAGRLTRVLPGYASDDSDIFALYLDRRNLLPRIRVFIDHLTAHFGPVPPWEREGG